LKVVRIKEQAYFTLARPLVEYASTVWDPYTQTDINKVEAVQRRAARYVLQFTIKTIYSCHCLDYRDTILALKTSGVSNSTMSGASRFQSRTVLGKNMAEGHHHDLVTRYYTEN
jgi:hypothetical protein